MNPTIRITIPLEDGKSTHGVTRWIGNVISGFPGYSIQNQREGYGRVEYSIRTKGVVESNGWTAPRPL